MDIGENWELLGHEWAIALLKEHIVSDNLRHAYLFTGPEGIGRRTLALRLAQAVNCQDLSAPGDPCRVCRTCQAIEKMQHPDLAVIRAEGSSGMLKVDQVRELQRSLSLAPYEARYRVALLLRFEGANPSAANALLKTLEEPPPQVLLMLTAESAESLMPTIVSRCEVLRLRPISLESTQAGLLSRWDLPIEQARLLAHLSAGRPGYALRLHVEPERMEQRQIWLDDHQRLLSAGQVERFVYAERITKEKDRTLLRQVLLTWLSLWRDILLRSAGSATPLVNLDRAEWVESLAGQVGLEGSRLAIASLDRTLDLLDRNVNARLATEVLMLDLPKI